MRERRRVHESAGLRQQQRQRAVERPGHVQECCARGPVGQAVTDVVSGVDCEVHRCRCGHDSAVVRGDGGQGVIARPDFGPGECIRAVGQRHESGAQMEFDFADAAIRIAGVGAHPDGGRVSHEHRPVGRAGQRDSWRGIVGRIKLARRDDGLGRGWTAPGQCRHCAARVFVIHHSDVVAPAGVERNRAGPLGRRLVDPLIDDELVVHPQTHTIVGECVKGVRFGQLRLHLAGPEGGKTIRADAGGR